MCPPITPPVPDLSHHCSDEELFVSLEKLVCGGRLPMNVTPDVNPYDCKPKYLPVGLWYFVVLRSLGAKGVEHGAWKATGEPRKIFSNDSICGWRATYRFCDQRSSNTSRDDWLMEEYTITQHGTGVKATGEDTNALCRVLRNCSSSIEQDLQQSHGPADILHDKRGNPTDSPDFNYRTWQSEASTINRQVNNIEAAVIVARDNSINQENVPDADWEDFPRDYLEINDLDIAPSPSSSSSNSSCMTMSSDQCFDSLGLLQDLENEIIQDMEKKGADHRFSVASVKPDLTVSYALSPGSSVSRIEGEMPTARNEIARFLPALATTVKTAGKNLLNQGNTRGRQNVGNNLAALSRAAIASSSNAQLSTTGKATATATGEGRKVGRRQIKMFKKLWFIPFQRRLPHPP